jgi:membrane protease YdiL (CAAX protease family)
VPRPVAPRAILLEVSRSARPGKQTIVFFLLWLLLGAAHAAASREGEGLPVGPLLVFDAVAFLATAAWAAGLRRDSLRLYLTVGRAPAPWVLAVLAAYPVALAVHVFVAFLERRFSIEVPRLTDEFLSQGYGPGAVALAICIQPAVVEELAFRGIIQTTVRDVMRPGEAIVVSAIAFSIMHWSLVMFVPFVILGAYFGWLREASGSLYPSMLAHFLHNGLVVLDERVRIFPL